MSRYTNVQLAVLLALLGGADAALAWGALGHRVTCDIAFRELTPAAREVVNSLVRADASLRTFADACVWADKIRSDARYDWAKPYHFVNVPRSARTVSVTRDCQPRGCAIAGIYRFAGVLRDNTSTQRDRIVALKFLGHFVGDVHQPLHVSFADDLGGNRITVRFFGTNAKLHFVWDTGIISRLGQDWRGMGGQLHDAITAAQRRAWTSDSPIQWANESLRITRRPDVRYVAAPSCCMRLDNPYLAAHKGVLVARLQQGGLRLASLLNAIWK
ncbi:MAG: S1/P1 nuclease [Pseudomonadota bacterium]